MLRPSMSQILKPGESYYEFVVAVARKAREIANFAEKEQIPLEEKPVTMAVEKFASGEVTIANMDVSIEGPVKAHAGEEDEADVPELPEVFSDSEAAGDSE